MPDPEPFAERLLQAEPCDSPYPLLAMLATSALLRADVGSAEDGPALVMSVQVARSRRPLTGAAVYVAQRERADAQAVQIADDAGIAYFRLHCRPPCDLRVKVYLTEDGQLSAIASDNVELPADSHGQARLRLAIAA